MSPRYFAAILALLFPLITAALDQSGGDVPSPQHWVPIKNIGDPRITQAAEFAVATYNIHNNTNLTFQEVTKGFFALGRVEEALYKLDIRVQDDKSVQSSSTTADYEAIIRLTTGSFGRVIRYLDSFHRI